MTVAGSCIDHVARQQVLDASFDLQWCRREALQSLADGRPEHVEVVASGDVAAWTMDQSSRWRELLSTRTGATGPALTRSLPVNRKACEDNGLDMVSVFDTDSTEAEARGMLEHEPSAAYYFAFAPLQIKIVDQRQVLIQGPVELPEQTLVSLTSPRALAAARRYWKAVGATATPCRRPDSAPALSDRQWDIFELMLAGRTDEAIARTLGVSVRTVRGDVGAAEATLGVRSRFAAGFAFATVRAARLADPCNRDAGSAVCGHHRRP